MTRTITIGDFGEEYGYGRFWVVQDGGHSVHANPQDVLKSVIAWLEGEGRTVCNMCGAAVAAPESGGAAPILCDACRKKSSP